MCSDSLADGKISSVFIQAVLRIVCLKMSIYGVKRASDENFCTRTLHKLGIWQSFQKKNKIVAVQHFPLRKAREH